MPAHLTMEERDRIAQLRYKGADQGEIARALKRAPSTISRELRRNRTGNEYYAAQAQWLADDRRSQRPLSRKLDDPKLNKAVREALAQEWSPEQIEGRLKEEHPDDPGGCVSAQTIYTWIEQHEDREYWRSCLRRRGKRPSRRKPAETGDAARIADRPPGLS